MSKSKRSSQPAATLPQIDPTQIAQLADRALAGDVVKSASIEEFLALLTELKARGYELKRRTEWEQKETPWLFLVVPVSQDVLARRESV